MALQERFSFKQGLTLGVQARIITGITDLTIDGVALVQANLLPRRSGTILLTIDGDSYQLDIDFVDENLEARDLHGRLKNKNKDKDETQV